MPRSMTGYGRAELTSPQWTLTWEIRSVNSRFLDIKWRTPHALRSQETDWERTVREEASRGRLDIHLHFQPHGAETAILASLNTELAKQMVAQMTRLAEDLGLDYKPDLNRLLSLQALWQESAAEPDPKLVADLDESLREALRVWNKSRSQEGRALANDLESRFAELERNLALIRQRVPQVLQDKTAVLAERIRAMVEQAGVEISDERMLQEVAILTDKLDVSEELTRLSMHLARMAKVLRGGGEVGRQLDFLLQETFREINTCGTKSQDAEISRFVVDFKATLEKCREQVQNIE